MKDFHTGELFAAPSPSDMPETPAPGAMLLRGFARGDSASILAAVQTVSATAPFRIMSTPGGLAMSVAMSNCGSLGWVSDRHGYRYSAIDPHSGHPWPAMPEALHGLARDAAARAGFADFDADACLINRYVPGARMALHQDRDERDLTQPVVSISLGLPADFLFGGLRRAERPRRIPLLHGDVFVWGGPARLAYHGVAPLKEGDYPGFGACRINLTLRKAGAARPRA